MQFEQIQQQKFPFSLSAIKAMVYFVLIYSVALFIHLIYTFQLLRDFKSSFEEDTRNL